MLTIFNRKELITTMDMQRQSNIRSILSANGIAYTVRTENLQGSSAFGGRSRGRSGRFRPELFVRVSYLRPQKRL